MNFGPITPEFLVFCYGSMRWAGYPSAYHCTQCNSPSMVGYLSVCPSIYGMRLKNCVQRVVCRSERGTNIIVDYDWSISLASVCLTVYLSRPVGILTVTHQGAACDTAKVRFGPTIRRTDILGFLNVTVFLIKHFTPRSWPDRIIIILLTSW